MGNADVAHGGEGGWSSGVILSTDYTDYTDQIV